MSRRCGYKASFGGFGKCICLGYGSFGDNSPIRNDKGERMNKKSSQRFDKMIRVIKMDLRRSETRKTRSVVLSWWVSWFW